jgi:DNA-directed RNA polymerase subunit RPC12/RpoP
MDNFKREVREELLEYTCPRCAQKFRASTSVAILSGTTQCPHCSHEFAAGGNVADEVKHLVESKVKGKEL